MSSAPTIDLETLLAPISEEAPAGEDLRADASPLAPYHAIKAARREARAEERPKSGQDEGDGGARAEIPDTRSFWRPVLDDGQSIISERSKDLEVVAWLTEALVRFHGFAGLRDAFALTQGLVENFWDGCYPRLDPDEPEEEAMEERLAQLSGLNGVGGEGTLVVPIRNVPLTEDTGEGWFATWHYQQAAALLQMVDPEVRQRRIDAGAVTMEMIESAIRASSEEFLRTTHGDLKACIEAFATLSAAFDAVCGQHAPPASTIRRELEGSLDALESISRTARGLDLTAEPAGELEAADGDQPQDDTDAPAGAGGPSAGAGQLRTREDALAALQRIADFFRQSEPHSPVSYAVEQAVRWGRMPLPDLLDELIEEEGAKSSLFRLAGIRAHHSQGDQEG